MKEKKLKGISLLEEQIRKRKDMREEGNEGKERVKRKVD